MCWKFFPSHVIATGSQSSFVPGRDSSGFLFMIAYWYSGVVTFTLRYRNFCVSIAPIFITFFKNSFFTFIGFSPFFYVKQFNANDLFFYFY